MGTSCNYIKMKCSKILLFIIVNRQLTKRKGGNKGKNRVI